MNRLMFLILGLMLSGCSTLDKSGSVIVGQGVNDSHIQEAKEIVVSNKVIELR